MSQRPRIHLVNPMWTAAGGSDLRTVELYRELSPHADVDLWSDSNPDPDLIRRYPIKRLEPGMAAYPRGGTLVFVGVYRMPGEWVALAKPRRAIVIYNTRAPRQLLRFMKHLFDHGILNVEIVYASELLKQETKLRGIVEHSPIDLARFRPTLDDLQPRPAIFTVGRLTRENPLKHHSEDPLVFRRLVEAGCRVRIMDGMCLKGKLAANSGVELLPAKAESAEKFLHGLDCFFYRTSRRLWETFGRVVHEAMACALPVVCHRRGGYITSIEHGVTGFLFDTTAQALEILDELQHDPLTRNAVGSAAREAMEAMYSPTARAKIIDYYLLGETLPPA